MLAGTIDRREKKMDERVAAEGRFLEGQHPNPWDRGMWYQAKLSNGRSVEIRKSRGHGRSRDFFLHVRWEVRQVILDEARTPAGMAWVHLRFNLSKGMVVEL